jgi:hypothetical protein
MDSLRRRSVADELGLPGKKCPDCAYEFGIAAWPLDFFNYNPRGDCAGGNDGNPQCLHPGCYSAKCTGHMLTARTKTDPWLRKVNGSFGRHAKEDGITRAQLFARWGTTPEVEAASLQVEYETGVCPKNQFGCGRAYRDMGHGPADITYDRIDPTKPFMPWNKGHLCLTCNDAKHKMPPERFAIRHRCWLIFDELPAPSALPPWRPARRQISLEPPPQLPGFEDSP